MTGAASGIGLEIADAFARRGARVFLVDIDPEALQRARRSVELAGAECSVEVCNVADESAVQALAERVHAEGGPIDVLVNNAGVFFLGGFQETPIAAWRRLLDINLLGVLHMTRAFLPAMQACAGRRRIVNVASLAGFLPAPNMSAYAASKHAVIGLSEVLAMELAAATCVGEVGVLVVCPGIINTPLAQGPAIGSNISERQLAALRTYYAREGCHPRLVAEGIAERLWSEQPFLFVGPQARPGHLLTRLSRRLARALSIRSARANGYLEPMP
ncbi:putative oxidoreductase EphD [Pseudomonas carbonaria]|uniref:Putative oxidoreductase EphD n=1 Tax=Zestomonas carbonaria TaxID=2762745 RepID=A0A7U7ERP7_9GAMM|nr:putative oxidoreductase EphD [Pseudomonas carbonaria]